MRPTNHIAPTPARPRASRLGAASVVSVTALAGVSGFVADAFGERVLKHAKRRAMLDIEAIEHEDCVIPHITMATFIHEIARQSGEEHLGLILAPHLSIASKGCWGEYMLGAPTLGEAIRRGSATIGFHSNGDVLSIATDNGNALLSYASPARSMEGYPHVACATAGILLSICRAYLPASWRPRYIGLDIARPRRPGVFEDTFQCPVLFNTRSVTVCLEAELLRTPAQQPGRYAFTTIENLARARVDLRTLDGLRDIIAQQIWSQVLTGHVSIESTAQSLNTSVRTLQRELNRQGTTFRRLASALRAKRASELLRHTDESVTSIAMSLGYSAPPHFTRAFRNATGMTPQEFHRHRARTALRRNR